MVINAKGKVELSFLEKEIIKNALNSSEVIAFPTDTVYGLGANALLKKSVEKIYKIKQRDKENPLILFLASIDEVSNYIEEPDLLKNNIFEKLNQNLPCDASAIWLLDKNYDGLQPLTPTTLALTATWNIEKEKLAKSTFRLGRKYISNVKGPHFGNSPLFFIFFDHIVFGNSYTFLCRGEVILKWI